MPKLRAALARVARKPGHPSLFERSFREDFPAAIDPDRQVERYSRRWRFSRPHLQGQFLMGRLGFIAKESDTQTLYDEARKDFVEQEVELGRGCFSHWFADLDSHLIVFELKPDKIEVQSFAGAFGGLLEGPTELAFTLELLQEARQFYEWADTVQRVTSFRAVLRAPNPGWGSRADEVYKDLIEQANADRVTVQLSKESDSQEGLVVSEGPIAGMVNFGETGYSVVRAQGIRDGDVSEYDSLRAVVRGTEMIPDHAPQELIWQVLRSLYERLRRRN